MLVIDHTVAVEQLTNGEQEWISTQDGSRRMDVLIQEVHERLETSEHDPTAKY